MSSSASAEIATTRSMAQMAIVLAQISLPVKLGDPNAWPGTQPQLKERGPPAGANWRAAPVPGRPRASGVRSDRSTGT